jgi:iron complex outermembrane receptor protein
MFGKINISRQRPCAVLLSSLRLLPFAMCPLSAMAQAPASTLPAIVVTGGGDTTLTAPASTGSNLGLTPMQTPASVEVITRDQLEERGDSSVVDAVSRAGGISAIGHPGNGGSSLSARGFTGGTSVMHLYDGTRLYGGVEPTFPFDTWSIERIEVLRGPASVIYGDGAIGGVVNVIPKKPSQGPVRNELQATVGSDDTYRLGLGSGGSLTDQLSYRVDLSAERAGGWVERGDSRSAAFSGALQWEATDDLSIKLSHAYGYQKPMPYFGTPLINGEQASDLRHRNYNVSDGVIRYRDNWTELAATWTPTDRTTVHAKLYHMDSKRDWKNAERYVYNSATGLIDRSDNTEIHHDQKQTGFTADAAFESTVAGLPNRLSVGFDINSSSSGPVNPYDPAPGYFHSDIPTVPRYRNEARQYSLFLEDRLELTPRWSVLAGLRYDHVDVSRKDLIASASAFDRTYADMGWRVGTVYDLTPDLALYAQYSEASDPVSGLLMLSPSNSSFEMSRGRQVEVGLKQTFLQGKGEWTLAAYHIRKSDLLTRDPVNPDLRQQVGEQSSRGLEGSVAVDLPAGWRVEANATLLRARFDDFSEAVGSPPAAVSRKGNVPPNVPQRLANVWVSWNFQPGWTAMGGLRYVGKRYADNANTLELPSYTTTDLALRWDAGRNTSITARAYNIFDREYFTTAYYTATQWFYGPGRRYELTLNHRF